MNATLAKSILRTNSRLSRAVNVSKVNRSITLPIVADVALDDIAAELGMSVNEFGRRALVHYAAAMKAAKAAAFRAALLCLAMTGLVWWQSIQPERNEKFARTKTRSGIVRTCKIKGRRSELEA